METKTLNDLYDAIHEKFYSMSPPNNKCDFVLEAFRMATFGEIIENRPLLPSSGAGLVLNFLQASENVKARISEMEPKDAAAAKIVADEIYAIFDNYIIE